MKEAINYFYNIYPTKVIEINDGVCFYYQGFKYYFIKYSRDVKEIDMLVKISNDLYERGVGVDTFILTNKKIFYVNINSEIYVLIRVNSYEEDILNMSDIIKFNNLLISNNLNMSEDWASLWERKVDELENEMFDLNNDYPIIQESSLYFIGLAENAIAYFRDTLIEDDLKSVKINLNHKRIGENPYSGVINNPLTFTFDYEVRDISEYIKHSFFASTLDYFEVEKIIDKCDFSRCSLRFLFARLLYPSYYFDLVEKVLDGEDEEIRINDYIVRIDEYEDFLMDVYTIINRKINIPSIPWIVNKG